ncbi:MAG: hypothetical protein KC468_15150, partial [Myxococcales bacterium]|nr:hypothetical protein [Myxococcales bacterium]
RLVSLLSVVVLGLGAILVSFGPLSLTVASLRTELSDAKRLYQQDVIDLRDEMAAAEALVLARQPSREVDALVSAIKAASGRDLHERPKIMQALVAAVATPQPEPLILRHPQRVHSLEFSSDGSLLLTACDDKLARLWDTASGEPLQEISGHRRPVRWAMFSPDQRHVLTVSDDHTSRLWELHTGIPIAIFRGQPTGNRRAVFSRNLDRLLTISAGGEPQLWDPDTETLIARLDHPRGEVLDVALSADGELIATGHADGALRLWHGRTGALLRTLTTPGAPQPLVSVAFTPDSERLLTVYGTKDATARLWDTGGGDVLTDFSREGGAVTHARLSATGRLVITLDAHGEAQLWSSDDGSLMSRFTKHSSALTGTAFSSDDARVVTYGRDGTARVWNTSRGELVSTILGHTGPIVIARFSPDGMRLVTASEDGTVRLSNALNGALVAPLEGHTGVVQDVRFSPDGSHLATIGEGREVRLWSTAVVNPLPVLAGHTGALRLARFSPDGTRIITAGEDRMARLWDAKTYTNIATLSAHGGPISAVVFPTSEASVGSDRFLTMADGDPVVHVWSSRQGEAVSSIPIEADTSIQAAAFSFDGAEILTTRRDGLTERWDVETGVRSPAAPCRARAQPVHIAVYSSDGRYLLTAGRERGDVELIDARTCDSVTLLEPTGPPMAILRARFSHDADKIVTITADHRAQVWRLPDGAHEATIEIPGDSVLSAAFAPTGLRLLLTGRLGGGEWSTMIPPRQISELPAQPGPILATSYSEPDGRMLVTAGGDTSARLWLANTGVTQLLDATRRSSPSLDDNFEPAYTLLGTLRGHRATITSVDFSPDARAVVTAGRDGVARVFPSEPEAYLQLACRMLHGYTGPYQEVEAYCRSL